MAPMTSLVSAVYGREESAMFSARRVAGRKLVVEEGSFRGGTTGCGDEVERSFDVVAIASEAR